MDLFLKSQEYLNGEYFTCSEDFFAICPYGPIPGVRGLCWEYDIIQKINRNEEGFFDFSKNLIDIGSEDGGYAIHCNFAKNYCFEANKEMCSLIYTNMYLKNKVKNTEVYNVFLGDDNGEVKFNGFSFEGSCNYSSSTERETPYVVKKHLLDEYDIHNVGLIKVDTEGFDYFVLKGGMETIRNSDYPPIIFENWVIGDNGWTKESHDRLNGFIESMGYTILENWGNSDTHLAVKLNKENRTKYIVSMTTVPSRKRRLNENLNSILNQSFKFDKLVINIDDNFSEDDYDFYFGLKELDSRIEVNVCDHKWRSCNKLLPTLKKYPNDVIITVDDDLNYPKNAIKVLVDDYEKNNDCIISLISDITMVDNGIYNGQAGCADIGLKQKNYSKYLSNCCLFPPHVFDGSDVYDYNKMMYCTNGTHDELWFWLNSTLNGVKTMSEGDYLENITMYELYDYSDKNEYSLGKINVKETVDIYTRKINEIYGERLSNILSERTEFVINCDNICTLFYNFFIIRLYYQNYVFDVESLPEGKIKCLRDFLNGSGINLDNVIK